MSWLTACFSSGMRELRVGSACRCQVLGWQQGQLPDAALQPCCHGLMQMHARQLTFSSSYCRRDEKQMHQFGSPVRRAADTLLVANAAIFVLQKASGHAITMMGCMVSGSETHQGGGAVDAPDMIAEGSLIQLSKAALCNHPGSWGG